MNTNFNSCCIPNLCAPRELYIVVQNMIPALKVKLVLQYIYKSELYTKESSIFGYDKTVRLPFKPNSWNIQFFIVEIDGSKSTSIFKCTLKAPETTCFQLYGSVMIPQLMEVQC